MKNVDIELSELQYKSQRINELETRFQNIIENLNDGFIIVNTGLQIILVNEALCKMLGYKQDELLGKSLLELAAHPRDQIALLRGIRRRINKFTDDYDFDFRTSTGNIIRTNVKPSHYVNNDGTVIGSFAVIKDLTHIKKVEKTLNYQVHLLDFISEGIIITNAGAVVEYVNSPAEEILDIDADALLNKNVFKLFTLNRKSYDIKAMPNDSMFDTILTETSYITPRGDKKYLRLSTAFLRNKYNALSGSVTIMSDITELIVSKQQALNVKNAQQDYFINICHDIRTPMIGIMGASELLKEEKLNDYQNDLVMTIEQSGKQLLELMNNILDLSKIETGHNLGELNQFNLFKLVDECVQTVYFLSQVNSIDISVDIASHIPPCLISYPLQLRRILLNLINNALKFTDKGFIKIIIDDDKCYSSYADDEIALIFSIEDSGVGIPSDELELIFASFYQATSSLSTGTGLGLTICKELVEKMGGQIGATSQIGQGTKIFFTLPFKIAPVITPGSNPETVKCSHPKQLKSKTVLLVEDNAINRQILIYMLNNAGFDVEAVGNGRECLSILEENNFDLIIMDMQMPVMDGLETTRLIRLNDKYVDIPIIALTAGVTNHDVMQCINAGCDYYLAKPISSMELQDALNTVMTQKDEAKPSSHFKPDSFWQELLPEFIITTTQLIENLEISIVKHDYEQIANITHDLKGVCGMYGFMEISRTASMTHNYAVKRDLPKLMMSYKQLKRDYLSSIKNKTSTDFP